MKEHAFNGIDQFTTRSKEGSNGFNTDAESRKWATWVTSVIRHKGEARIHSNPDRALSFAGLSILCEVRKRIERNLGAQLCDLVDLVRSNAGGCETNAAISAQHISCE